MIDIYKTLERLMEVVKEYFAYNDGSRLSPLWRSSSGDGADITEELKDLESELKLILRDINQ